MTVAEKMKLIGQHLAAKRPAEAEPLLRAVVQSDPANVHALHALAFLLGDSGRLDEAAPLYERAIALQPKNLNIRLNLAVMLTKRAAPGDGERAVDVARRALKVAPGDATMMQVLAQAYDAADRHKESAETWRWAADNVRPTNVAFALNWGKSCDRYDNVAGAKEAYERVLALDPNHPEGLALLAQAMHRLHRIDDALAVARRAVAAAPASPEGTAVLAMLFAESGNVDEGEALLRRVLELDRNPGSNHRATLGRVLTQAGRSHEALAEFENFLQASRNPRERQRAWTSMLLVSLNVSPDDPVRNLDRHRLFETQFLSSITRFPPARRRPSSEARKLRVGFVSGDFREHSVATFFHPLLIELDRSKLEIHCFDTTHLPDPRTRQMQALGDRWHTIDRSTDREAAQLIRDLEIDVLLDLAGHTKGNRLGLFAYRPAPLQMTYLGYPSTTGLTSIDCRITDAVADPPGESDAHHSERLLRMPHVFATPSPPTNAPPIASLPALECGHVTFATPSGIAKLSEETIDLWSAALRAVPTARMMFIGAGYGEASIASRLQARFGQRDVDPERLSFHPRQPFGDFLKLHSQFDLVLDTTPFNGHTTTVHGLWMGVPVLTLRGQSHRARMGTSVLTALGLTDFIASSHEDFANRAARIASDLAVLKDLRATMRERLQSSPLFDTQGFARSFEQLLFTEWAATAPRT